MEMTNQARRSFIKQIPILMLGFPTLSLRFCSESSAGQPVQRTVGGGCDGCAGIYEGMPSNLPWETRIGPASEPGEPMEISGIIFRRDGKTPAADVILYVYQTDAKGLYSPAENATGNARRHGHLRGWMKTNSSGEYKFITIKPAPYPNANAPAHIHPIIKESRLNEYYIDEYRFDDDPLMTAQQRAASENRGGSGIIKLVKDPRGVWTAKRNIILGLNIPGYPQE
jgi:protocatechuate 3,4-dioxygenase, beta subunit